VIDTCWWPELVCPECHAQLHRIEQSFSCGRCDLVFPGDCGIVRFLTAERQQHGDAFYRQYRIVRDGDGHGLRSAEEYRALPRVAAEREDAAEWRIRRQTFDSLLRWSSERGSTAMRLLDIGAGTGWLSHQVGARGHRPVALDRYDDAADGLGVCRVYDVPFPVVQADFDALPFAAAQFDAVVFNASLHYSPDPARTLAEAERVLAPDGAVIVMDSPLFDNDRDGEAMLRTQAAQLRSRFRIDEPVRPGVGFLTRERLALVARSRGWQERFVETTGPMVWRLRRWWGGIRLGRAPAAFGMWVAR
jgi:SAM-dependent methyltransferase